MPSTTSGADGSLKLRGLLRQSTELLRRGRLEQAFTNAQIVKEFALRSGEAAEVTYRARLFLAHVHALRAHAGFDPAELGEARRILETLEAEGLPYGSEHLARELALARAQLDFAAGDLDAACARCTELLATDGLPPVLRLRVMSTAAETDLAAGRWGEDPDVPERLRGEALGLYAAHATDRQRRADAAAPLARLLLAEARAVGEASPPRGLDLAQRARAFATANADALATADAEVVIGRLSRRRGNYAIALRLLYSGLDGAQAAGQTRLALEAHAELARAYLAVYEDREAEKHLMDVADLAERYGRGAERFFAAYSLGCLALRADRREEATAWLTEALNAAAGRGCPIEQATALAEIGGLHAGAGNLELARHYRDAARKRFGEAAVDENAKAILLSARLALHDGASAAALAAAERAVALAADEARPALVVEAHRCRGAAHEALGQAPEALAAERDAGALLSRLIRQRDERRLGGLDMRAALREREREIEKLTRENDLKGALLAKNEEIERANADLLQANEELRQFAFVASHDLKEPLRQVGSYVSLLKRRYGEVLDEDGRAYVGFVSEGVARLNRLFDSLMHYTAVARLDKDLRDVDLTRLVDAVRQEFSASIRDTGARLEYGRLPTVQTGPKLLRHVFAALVDNALRFRREGVAPVIRIDAAETDGCLVVGVRDNGIGIDGAYADRVFQLFQMLEAKSGNPGTGVGLAIAQKTVQRLGGRIWFEDNPDGSPGVTFRFTLPLGVERTLPGAGGAALAEEAA